MTAAVKSIPMFPILTSGSQSVEENRLIGFIKLYRSIENKSWYKKSEYVHLWVHLFIKATRKEKQDWFGGKPITLKPGQLITGRKKLSTETGIQESKIERILKCFTDEQQIEQQTNNVSRLISITNWHLYQNVEQPTGQQMNNGRTTGEQRVNTIQEGKEYKEDTKGAETPEKPKKKIFTPPTDEEVLAYVNELTKNHPNSVYVKDNFMNHYQSNGWRVGKAKMSDWKATMRNCLTWEKSQRLIGSAAQGALPLQKSKFVL